MEEKNLKYCAVMVITDIWSCIDWEKVDSRRAIGIWDEFTSKVKAATSTTSSLERFIEKLSRKMDVRSLRFKSTNEILELPEEEKKQILKYIRENSISIVLQLRLNNDARKEERRILEEEKRKRLEEEANSGSVIIKKEANNEEN